MFRNPFDKGWKANWAQAMFPWRQPMEGVTVEMSPGAKQLSEAETRGTSVGTGMIDFNALRSGRGGDSEESPLLKGRGSEHVHGPNCRHHH